MGNTTKGFIMKTKRNILKIGVVIGLASLLGETISNGVLAGDDGKKVTGSYLGGTGSKSDPAKIKMTIKEKAPKPFGIEKHGDQYRKNLGGGTHVFGQGNKDEAVGGIGIDLK